MKTLKIKLTSKDEALELQERLQKITSLHKEISVMQIHKNETDTYFWIDAPDIMIIGFHGGFLGFNMKDNKGDWIPAIIDIRYTNSFDLYDKQW